MAVQRLQTSMVTLLLPILQWPLQHRTHRKDTCTGVRIPRAEICLCEGQLTQRTAELKKGVTIDGHRVAAREVAVVPELSHEGGVGQVFVIRDQLLIKGMRKSSSGEIRYNKS
jgi:hypothetical protein